jgi:hypothetical protein
MLVGQWKAAFLCWLGNCKPHFYADQAMSIRIFMLVGRGASPARTSVKLVGRVRSANAE